jgi:pimeloyl-ACP methyl ester carboxylesterase
MPFLTLSLSGFACADTFWGGRFAVWRANAQGFDARLHVSNITVPVLYVHSEHDRMIPIDHSRELYRATRNGHAELWEVTDAGHSEILNLYGDEYRARVSTFVERHLPRAEQAVTATMTEATDGF